MSFTGKEKTTKKPDREPPTKKNYPLPYPPSHRPPPPHPTPPPTPRARRLARLGGVLGAGGEAAGRHHRPGAGLHLEASHAQNLSERLKTCSWNVP